MWVKHTCGGRRGSCHPLWSFTTFSASSELNVNPFKALPVKVEKARKCFFTEMRLLKVCISIEGAIAKEKSKWLSKYCEWQWPSWGEWIQGWVQSAAVNKLFVLCFHALQSQKSIGVNYSLLFTLGLFIIPCVVGDMFHYKKQFAGHTSNKKKNQFLSMHDFLLSLANLYPPYPQTYPCVAYLAIERGYCISRLFPHYFYFSAHHRKGS